MKIDSGVFFAKGFPVRTDAASIILDKNSANPTCRVGFVVAENIVTYIEDPTLVSNAAGFPNFAAPGADRLQLVASFQRFGFTDTLPAGYVELVTVLDGVIQSMISRSQYDDIMDELARRTYQQSGDYIVTGMTVKVKEHLDNGFNNGYLTANNGGNSQQLVVGVNPGEAYVKGYDVQYLVTKYVPIDKALDFKNVDNVSIQAAYGNFVSVTQVAGGFDVTNGTQVNLYSAPQNALTRNSYIGGGANGSIIGTARVRDLLLTSGNYGDLSATYDLFLYDIRMTSGDFKSVQSVVSTTGIADVILDTSNNAVLVDAKFDYALFPLTLQAVRSLRDANNAINNDYIFEKSFSVTMAANGTVALSTGASDEVFPYSPGALTTLQEQDFKVVLNAAATVALTGTVTLAS
jgi:hypothetical protein